MDEQNQQQKFTEGKKLVNQALMDTQIDDKVQQMINVPQKDDQGMDEADNKFINAVMLLIRNQTINLYIPETLLNKPVYEKLDLKAKGIADLNAVTLLGDLRQIKKLFEQGFGDTYQIKNLIHHVRVTKERLEAQCGDIYII